MTIYLIDNRGNAKKAKESLNKYGKVLVMDSGATDLEKYPELFTYEGEKLLGVNPSVFEWKLPIKELKRIKNLKGIATKSAWAEYIDLDYCKENHIAVTNCPGANSQSVAEYALWMMLSLARKLPLQMVDDFKKSLDDEHKQVEILGRTMGIVGLGNIGSRLAKMGEGLGMRVMYWSRSKKDVDYEYVLIDDLMKQADFVVNCLELCDETKGFFDKKRLSMMKKSAYFVSVMGGAAWGIEDNELMLKMVKDGDLAGMAVEGDHGGDFPKKVSGNVFIPGAYAFYTSEAEALTLDRWIEGIEGIVTGKKVNRVV